MQMRNVFKIDVLGFFGKYVHPLFGIGLSFFICVLYEHLMSMLDLNLEFYCICS